MSFFDSLSPVFYFSGSRVTIHPESLLDALLLKLTDSAQIVFHDAGEDISCIIEEGFSLCQRTEDLKLCVDKSRLHHFTKFQDMVGKEQFPLIKKTSTTSKGQLLSWRNI